MSAPLTGITVLDLSRVLAGPWASQTLADLGAEVIKIERPGVGDDTRTWGPPFFETRTGDSLSAYYLSANRGKQSVCIDISTQSGADLVRRLAQDADILIENFKFGDMARRGLDYEALSTANPGLIYCSITGFGQSGPYRHRPGYDFMIQGMGGLMSITGEPDEKSTDGPQKVGVALADVLTGLYSTIAILAALQDRVKSGQGQQIDMALLDVLTASLANQATNYLVSGIAPSRLGNAHPNVVPYQTFSTSDGYIIVAVGNDAQFVKLCHAIDRPDLATHADYLTNALRVQYREALSVEIAASLSTGTMAAWLDTLEAAGVPCGPINTIDRVFNDPQVIHRGLQIAIDGMPLVANPIRYSKSEMNYQRPPPTLGQDTADVLIARLGLTQTQLEELRQQGVVN
ncbi:MAG: CaiB/BaiF CoA-transferase family protein [Pseudomonadales bacterium]